jgi:hypothetical protein
MGTFALEVLTPARNSLYWGKISQGHTDMYELITEVGDDRQVQITIPEIIRTKQARIIILPFEPEQEPEQWMRALAQEWQDELADERQDIYSLEDGEPVDATR